MRPIPVICALVATMQLLCGTAVASGGWTWPVRGPVLTAYRNGDDPYAAGQHRGVDIGAPVGARVVAATGGTVSFVGVAGSSGLTVSERTADGRFDLSYLHLSAVAVHRGDAVAEGEPLGAVGVSGRRSADEPHLHFGVREAGARTAYRDPLDFLAAPPANEPDPAPAPVTVAAPERTPSAVPEAAGAEAGAAAPAALPALPVPAPHGAPSHPGGGHVPAPATAVAPVAPREAAATLDPASSVAPGSPLVQPPGLAPGHGGTAPNAGDRAAARTAGAPHGPGSATGRSRATTAAAPPGAAAHPHRRGHGAPGGIDLGWLAACLGLVATAGVLGRQDRARKAAARGHTRLAGLLRPTPRRG